MAGPLVSGGAREGDGRGSDEDRRDCYRPTLRLDANSGKAPFPRSQPRRDHDAPGQLTVAKPRVEPVFDAML